MLTFDEAEHQYQFNGVVKPSVTQVLGALSDFSLVPRDVLAAACARGSYVHTLTEYHDQGDLDPTSIGEYGGYLDAWVKFCADHDAKWDGIEVRGYSERFGYAGTHDRHGTLRGSRFVVDVKTSVAPSNVWNLQLAAYRQLLAERDPAWMLARLATVQLRNDGTYKFIEWSDQAAWPTFLSLLTLRNWSSK